MGFGSGAMFQLRPSLRLSSYQSSYHHQSIMALRTVARAGQSQLPRLASFTIVSQTTSTRQYGTAGEPNYPGHIPLTTAQNALLAVGSGVVGVLDTTRGGKSLIPLQPITVSSPI